MNTDWLLWLQLIIFLSFTFVVGLYTRNWVNSATDFFLAGRQLNWLVIGTLTAAVLISGAIVPAASGFGYKFGFSSIWYLASWCVSVIFVGVFFVKYWRRMGSYTIPEWYEMKFGLKTRLFFSGYYTFATALAAMCQVVGLGITIQALTGVPYHLTTWAAGFLYMSYIFMGGQWASAVNSFFQAIICSVGMVALMIYLTINYGSITTIATQLPAEFMLFPGSMSWGPWIYYSVIGLLWGWICCVWPQQYYYANAIGARTEKHAVKGFIFAGIYAFVFFALTVPTVGVYARIIFPNINGEASFGMLVKTLPMGLNGLVLLVIVSGALSTACPQIIGASALALREFYVRLINTKASTKQTLRASRVSTLIVGFFVILGGSLFSGSASQILAIFFAASAPLVPSTLAMMFWPKVTKEASVISSGTGFLAAMGWLLWGSWNTIHGMWIGFLVAAPLLIIITYATQHRSWWRDASTIKVGEDLDEIDMQILNSIRKGKNTQDKVLDILKGEAVELTLRIKKLEQKGYLNHEKESGIGYLNYILTEEGAKALPSIKKDEKDLIDNYRISLDEVEVFKIIRHLELVGDNKKIFLNDVVKNSFGQISNENIGASISLLIDRGYIKESGIFKVKLASNERFHNAFSIKSDDF